MKPFTESAACKTGVHCATCRDRDGGRDWRVSLRVVYDTPGDDFDCPHGRAWNAVRPNDAAAVLAACRGCEHFKGLQDNGLYLWCADRACCSSPVGEVSLRYGSCARWPAPGE